MRKDVKFLESWGSTFKVTMFKSGEGAVQNLGAIAPAPVTKVPSPNAERNAWVYNQYVNHPKKTLDAIMREAKTKGWTINSDPHLLQCVDNHCDANGFTKTRRNPPRT
jgi:hypothetical protein